MTNEEFERLLPQHNTEIKSIARLLASGNKDLYEDLYQEGLITFWNLDLSRATDNLKAWVRSAVRNRMIDYLRKQRLYGYGTESLDKHLWGGAQVTEDPITGGAQIIRPTPKQQQAEQDEREERDGDRYLRLRDEK